MHEVWCQRRLWLYVREDAITMVATASEKEVSASAVINRTTKWVAVGIREEEEQVDQGYEVGFSSWTNNFAKGKFNPFSLI